MAGKKGWTDQAKKQMVETTKTNKQKRDEADKALKDQEKK